MAYCCIIPILIVSGIFRSAPFVLGQDDDDCVGVESGLNPILEPCSLSVSKCVTAQDLPSFSKLFCLPQAENQFNNFNRCTNRNFSDQLFGALCGGSDCSGTGGTCLDGDLLCFQTVDRNNATKVFEECDCDAPSSGNECPSASCKASLEELLGDVGCCINTVLYTFYLNQCKTSPGSTLFTQDGLARLFAACDLSYPSSCRHPFSINIQNSANAPGRHCISFAVIILMSLLFKNFI